MTAKFSRGPTWRRSPTCDAQQRRDRAEQQLTGKGSDDGRDSRRPIRSPMRRAGDRRRHSRAHGGHQGRKKDPSGSVILLEKANVKRSGAISMGMDGLNNAVIPGYATPEQYTKEITIANDGIVDQAPVYKYAQNCFDMIQELDRFGIRFQKNENGDYRRQEGASHRHLCAADAEWRHGQEGALPATAPRAGPDFQPVHGDAPADRQGWPRRRRDLRQYADGGIARDPRQGRDHVHGRRRPPRPARIRLSLRHLRERRPIPATDTPWPITPARGSRTSNAIRSIR